MYLYAVLLSTLAVALVGSTPMKNNYPSNWVPMDQQDAQYVYNVWQTFSTSTKIGQFFEGKKEVLSDCTKYLFLFYKQFTNQHCCGLLNDAGRSSNYQWLCRADIFNGCTINDFEGPAPIDQQ